MHGHLTDAQLAKAAAQYGELGTFGAPSESAYSDLADRLERELDVDLGNSMGSDSIRVMSKAYRQAYREARS